MAPKAMSVTPRSCVSNVRVQSYIIISTFCSPLLSSLLLAPPDINLPPPPVHLALPLLTPAPHILCISTPTTPPPIFTFTRPLSHALDAPHLYTPMSFPPHLCS
ncbi:hypothetical protein E2C01_070781 [Portunus trituberculatus]|uniref:Uncharacterized protein n=1 Tax=Portunus trituberculatus TaxID=210409 RepID=A0A5B7HTM8_PORTR|nr:hypothetical protein [Portunus trituberculatus]